MTGNIDIADIVILTMIYSPAIMALAFCIFALGKLGELDVADGIPYRKRELMDRPARQAKWRLIIAMFLVMISTQLIAVTWFVGFGPAWLAVIVSVVGSILIACSLIRMCFVIVSTTEYLRHVKNEQQRRMEVERDARDMAEVAENNLWPMTRYFTVKINP